ncbi:hypothetical protein ES707_13761 [subsurface metagenome]
MNNVSTKGAKKPSIYIDTCIARDITERRVGRDASIELLGHIKSKNWTCKMSVFGLMELVDIEQESLFVNLRYFVEKQSLDEVYSSRRNRNLGQKELEKSFQYIEQFQNNYSFIDLVGMSEDGWSLAIVVASNSNLLAADVIHLVSAWQEDCDLVVTDDNFFVSEAKTYLINEGIRDKLRVCLPKDCYSVLADMGYTDI